MQIGTHVSASGGLWNAPGNAAKLGVECFQIFSRSPHGGPVTPITKDVVKKFQAEMDKHGFKNFYIHTPYFINFSSAKPQTYYGSISVVRGELDRGSLLGARAIMTHLGSFGDYTEKEGLKKVAEGVAQVMKGYKGKTILQLEISAGSGKIVGDTFEELAAILDNKVLKGLDVRICLDTCHMFASGYDIRTKKGVDETLKKFDKLIGYDKLVMVHSNDSKFDIGTHKDRHENLGQGFIGLEGFKALAKHKVFGKLDWILETPKDDPKDDPKNIAILKKLRK